MNNVDCMLLGISNLLFAQYMVPQKTGILAKSRLALYMHTMRYQWNLLTFPRLPSSLYSASLKFVRMSGMHSRGSWTGLDFQCEQPLGGQLIYWGTSPAFSSHSRATERHNLAINLIFGAPSLNFLGHHINNRDLALPSTGPKQLLQKLHSSLIPSEMPPHSSVASTVILLKGPGARWR